jgi:anti-sigma regulatory factor (Ser/Thr protein kinase)
MLEELSLHVLDIAMNSLAAGARRIEIGVTEDAKADRLTVSVRDDGRGMDEATLQRVLAQAATTKASRKKPIGLGLALLRQTAEMCAGRFEVKSAPGKGTAVTATMQLSHVDRPPVGDLGATILALCAANPDVDVRLNCRADGESFQFSSQEGKNNEHRRTQEAEGKGAAASRAA